RRRGRASKHAGQPARKLAVEQLQHRDRDDPREERNHLVNEAAHEADRCAADQEQEDEDVERGHTSSASGGEKRAPALTWLGMAFPENSSGGSAPDEHAACGRPGSALARRRRSRRTEGRWFRL